MAVDMTEALQTTSVKAHPHVFSSHNRERQSGRSWLFQMFFAKLWFLQKVWAKQGFPLFSPLPPPSSSFPCSSWQFCNKESWRGEKVANSTVEKIFWRRSEQLQSRFLLWLSKLSSNVSRSLILCQRCSGLTIGLRDSGWADNLSQEDLIRVESLIPRFAQWNHTGETEPKQFLHSWVALLKVILLKVILISVHFLIIIKILKSFPRSCFPSRATLLTSAHMEATPLYPLHWSPGSAKLCHRWFLFEIVSSHISILCSVINVLYRGGKVVAFEMGPPFHMLRINKRFCL